MQFVEEKTNLSMPAPLLNALFNICATYSIYEVLIQCYCFGCTEFHALLQKGFVASEVKSSKVDSNEKQRQH